ncbi:MAG: chemotaxis response regulator protein-glutamate methylesterase [Deltaproteobacteria bacterium]|nr:chemotaxis response regulator protein-glutamate methylesterase [Deltaproteobacteria bacterium]
MPQEDTLQVLVVDDSALYRRVVQDVLAEIPGVAVVGVAQNGRIALKKIEQLHPDLITLDIEMPEMDGLETLSHLHGATPGPGVIILSDHSVEGARFTLKALELGAFDFVPKPREGTLEENHERLKKSLSEAITAFKRVRYVQKILKPQESSIVRREKTMLDGPVAHGKVKTIPFSWAGQWDIKAVAIGISTGGPAALPRVITKLPENFPVPLFIVQHMPPIFTQALAAKLNSRSAIEVKEGQDGETVRSGVAYIAPGGLHMGIASRPDHTGPIIRVVDTPPVNNCKPSVDHLFFSIAEHYKEHALGVIMTGMGSDGTEGLKRMKEWGAAVIAQDEASSVVYSMPRKPVEEGIVDRIVPLEKIADEIRRILDR